MKFEHRATTDILTLNGVIFTPEEITEQGYGWIEKDGKRFYRGNRFDTPYDHDGELHEYVEVGVARLFAF
jgi:hypothetical protein